MRSSLEIGIAEDEPDMREFYQIIIPELGHRLLWAARNGIELVECVRDRRPDLLIVDIQMPQLDGLVAVRRVTRDQPVPVIVVSGHHDQETMQRAEAELVMGYLVKPIREADLMAAITIATKRFDELRVVREARARRTARQAKARHNVLNAIRAISTSGRISRAQALSRLRELAKKEQRTLSEVSQTIVDSVEGLGPRQPLATKSMSISG